MSGTAGGNPLIAQGTLNRIRGSVTIPGFPSLNVTAPFLGKEGISLTLEGNTTTYIPTMTGAVTSPEPYQMVSCEIHLLKSQGLAALYKAQMELLATIGNYTVRPDATTLPDYSIINGAISDVRALKFDGTDAGWVTTLKGYYLINSSLFTIL
jgi:hypothetical protein